MKKRLSILTLMLLVVASISTWALQSKLFATQGDEGTEPQTQGSCLGTLPEEGKMYPQAFIKEFSQEEIQGMLQQLGKEGTLNAGYLFQTFNPNNKIVLPSGKEISDWEISQLFDLLELRGCESVEALVNKSMKLIGDKIDNGDKDAIEARLTEIYTEMFPYKDYQADFVVSFDEDVDDMYDYQLWGYYATYNATAQCPSADLDANEPYRLLKEGIGGFLGGYIDSFNYFAIAGFVQDFYCGVWGNDDMAGKTITVQLRLFNGKDINSDYYVVSETKYTFPECKIGDKRYATLAQAVEEVNEGETIELLSDVTNAKGISVPENKNFTVDFGGHTYTVNKPGAGSLNTQTQAFQLLKNSTITFKNGTIKCAEENKDHTWTPGATGVEKGIAMIIQNYANLTLEDMTIDGTNIAHNAGKATPYIVSNNSGHVEFKGETSIIAPAGDFAFDVCKSDSYEEPTVTWNSSGKVKGHIELSGGTFIVAENLTVNTPILCSAAANLTVNEGKTVKAEGFSGEYNSKGYRDNTTGVIIVKNGGDLTIEGAGTINSTTAAYAAIVMTEKGDASTNPAKLTVNGGTFEGQYYGIAGNGNRPETDVTINGGTFSATNDGFCIYQPQKGNLTINDGTFNGYTCVGIKSGKLNISGGTFTATGAEKAYTPNSNGMEETGEAIIIDNCDYPGGEPSVSITGGLFTAEKNRVVGSYYGGKKTEPLQHFISGGVFNQEPKQEGIELIAEGFVAVKGTDNFWTVERSPECKIGDKMYATLAKAVEEVNDGETIELLSDVVLGNVTINIGKDNVTLEGNGKTIALDEEDANLQKYGENGTSKSYGSYQMITVSGNNVTLQNMTLDSKGYRGASLATTTGGSNVTYKNITYQGKGSGHYYGYAPGGNLTFEGCTFNTCGFAIHTAETACNLIVKDCVINGWTSYGSATLSASFTNTKFGPTTDKHNGTLATIRAYTNTTIKDCSFSPEYKTNEKYKGITVRDANAVVTMEGCTVVDGDNSTPVDDEIANFENPDDAWINGGILAIDAKADAENGYTAGTFVALDIEDIKPAVGYKVKAVEGKTNVYTVSAPAEEVEIPEEKKDEIYSGETKLEGEQKEHAQQQIKDMAENENIAEVMADKVNEETGEVVKVNNPEEVIENGQSTDAMTVKVAFESAKVEAATESVTITEVAYNVTPKLVTTDEEGKTTERTIENNEIKSPIIFALPVDDIPEDQEQQPKYKFAQVYHWREVEGKETVKEYLGTKPITFDNVKGNYILISSLEFSIFSYELTDKDATLLYVSNEEMDGKTVTEQEFFENIQPYHPNALAFVGSDKEQFARNNTNVVYATKVQEVQNLDDLSDDLICPNLVLTDISTIQAGDRETVNTDFYTPKAFTATKLTYTREGTKGLNSVYLPFAFAASDIDCEHPSDIKIGVFEKVVKKYADLEYDFAVFNVVESLNPEDFGVACLVKDVRNLPDEEDYVWNIQKANVEILTNNDWNRYQDEHNAGRVPCLKGSLTTMPLSGNVWKIDATGEYFGTADGGKCYPFRSYLVTSAGSGTKLRIAWSDEATGISTIETIDNAKDGIMYNLLGVKVGNDYQGVVIKNGKTMLKK
ncbi:MAG: hypothetical protein KBT06_01845 [Prevotellaceae bacterium]|nr:hypothetical protein [Candidatus Colivivens equi]